jgi:hypothetical protein
MLGFKGQYVCPIRLLSHCVVHCDPITLGGGGTCAAPEQASRNAIPDGNVVKFQKSGKPQAPPIRCGHFRRANAQKTHTSSDLCRTRRSDRSL